jgi:hypothetical protein
LLVPLDSGPVFDNRRTPTGRQQFALAASDQLTVAALPQTWRAPQAALLAPVAGELAHNWSTAFAPATFVALAAQGLLRRLHAGEEVVRLAFEHGPIIGRANAIALSQEDVVAGAPPIREWTRPGQHLLVTHGKRGSVVLETGFGELEVGISEGTAAWLDVSSLYGTVRSELDASDGPETSDETVKVRARTGYGDVVIRRP